VYHKGRYGTLFRGGPRAEADDTDPEWIPGAKAPNAHNAERL